MSERLLLSSNVILRREPQYYNTYVAFDCKRVRTEFLTEEEYRVLEHIYSKPGTVAEVSAEAKVDHKKSEKLLGRMIRLGFVEKNNGFVKTAPPERVKAKPELFRKFAVPFLSAPMSVDVFVTSRCNLKCVHCFANGDERNVSELSLKDLDSIFNQLESMGVLEVRINGGEPLLHRGIEKILLSLKRRRFRKVILTNGTLLNKRIASLLKESETIPTISLDDSEAEAHDRFRGVRGAFNQTVEAMQLLKEQRIEYGVNCCLHKGNSSRYDDVIRLAEKYGASRIALLGLKPTGRMKNNLKLAPSYKEYEELLPSLMLAKSRHRKIDVSLDAYLHCYPLKESIVEARRGYVSCEAGKTRLSIDGEGYVYPCNVVISDLQWRMGNIRREKIWNIWFSEKWAFFRGKVKTEDLQKCSTCRNLMCCPDFYCRLLPYVTEGNEFGPHPKCALSINQHCRPFRHKGQYYHAVSLYITSK